MIKLTANQKKTIDKCVDIQEGCNALAQECNYATRKVEPTLVKDNGVDATIYRVGAFGVKKTECKLACHGSRNYGQHAAAFFASYILKGKRKPSVVTQTTYATLFIMEGHNLPDFENFETVSDNDLCTVRKGLHSSCSSEWGKDLKEFIAKIDTPMIASFESGATC